MPRPADDAPGPRTEAAGSGPRPASSRILTPCRAGRFGRDSPPNRRGHASLIAPAPRDDEAPVLRGASLLARNTPAHTTAITADELEPRSFSFNSPHGACPGCAGLGTKLEIDPDLIVRTSPRASRTRALLPWARMPTEDSWRLKHPARPIATIARLELQATRRDLPPSRSSTCCMRPERREGRSCGYRARAQRGHVQRDVRRRSFRTSNGAIRETESEYIEAELRSSWSAAVPHLRRHGGCAPEALQSRSASTPSESLDDVHRPARSSWVTSLGRHAWRELERRDRLPVAQGDRSPPLLPAQRGARLPDAEPRRADPERRRSASASASRASSGASSAASCTCSTSRSIGLHQRDNQRLIATLRRLRDLGNSVVVVEHDEETIRAADHVVDFGPGAGHLGGKVLFSGSPEEIERDPKSLTGAYMSGRKRIEMPGDAAP